MKKILCLIASAVLAAGVISGCSSSSKGPETSKEPVQEDEDTQQTELIVFAAASMTDTMNEIAEMYKAVEPDVNIVYNFDSSGTLKTPDTGGGRLRYIYFSRSETDEPARRRAGRRS